jgi:hypothetical protein
MKIPPPCSEDDPVETGKITRASSGIAGGANPSNRSSCGRILCFSGRNADTKAPFCVEEGKWVIDIIIHTSPQHRDNPRGLNIRRVNGNGISEIETFATCR